MVRVASRRASGDLCALDLSKLLAERALPLLQRDPARAWRDLEQAAAHARAAAAFHEASQAELARLEAQPLEDAVAARRLSLLFIATRLAAELNGLDFVAEPRWAEANALNLERQLPTFRAPRETLALQRRPLEAGATLVPNSIQGVFLLAQVLAELREDAEALRHLERILALDAQGAAWSRQPRLTRQRAEDLRANLLRRRPP